MHSRLLVFLFTVTFLCACGTAGNRPDLERLYAGARHNSEQPPVILIHGLLGARLTDSESGREVWPGSFWKVLLSRYAEAALPIDPDTLLPAPDTLQASSLFDASVGNDYFKRILYVLETAGGYQQGTPGVPVTGSSPHYYVLLYDWRQDNVKTARQLHQLITQIQRDYGVADQRVDIIAHSMGGLAARYYARYGTVDLLDGNDFPVTLAGAANIRRLILLGTPNLGSVEAIAAMIDGERLGLRKVPPEILMTMPAMYQLFPHALHNWLITEDGRPIVRDQFDATIWQRFKIGPWNPTIRARMRSHGAGPNDLALLEAYFERQLERARRFTWSLTVPQDDPSTKIVIFGGVCTLTPARLLVEERDGESFIRLQPRDQDEALRMLEPGDGSVAKASLLARDALSPSKRRHRYIHFPDSRAFFLCERHTRLTANISFQDNLLHTLLSVD